MAYQEPLIMTLPGGGQTIDPGRKPACVPGYLVHSAQMNEEALICCHRACCFCMAPEQVARRTFVDVYSNGVLINVPRACCCCLWNDNAKFVFFDKFIGEPTPVNCCYPAPHCCAHGCGCCGEALGFKNTFGCPSGVGHASYAIACCCCPLDVILGLEGGQGAILTNHIEQSKSAFEQAGCQSPPPPDVGGSRGMSAPQAVASVAAHPAPSTTSPHHSSSQNSHHHQSPKQQQGVELLEYEVKHHEKELEQDASEAGRDVESVAETGFKDMDKAFGGF